MKRVKKSVVILAMVTLALAAVWLLPGCGEKGDKPAAKEHMTKADRLFSDARDTSKAMEEKQAKLVQAAIAQSPNSAQLTEEMRGIMEEIYQKLDEAESEYNAILRLSDVEDYQEYAQKMLVIVGKFRELIAGGDALLDYYLKTLSAGQKIDVMQLLNSEEKKKLDAQSEEIDQLIKEADDFQREKSLRL